MGTRTEWPRAASTSAAAKEPHPGRFALSPDGRHLALVASDASGHSMLWVRPLDGVVAQPLAGTGGATFPFWSPDSRFLAFITRPSDLLVGRSTMKKIEVTGGQPVTICDLSFGATGTWNRDDVILLTPAGKTVGVGIPIAGHPLHRSGRAELPHPAPALGS